MDTASAISTVADALVTGLSSTASEMAGVIAQLVPIGVPVAGAIIVIAVGWKVFRMFTKG